MKTQEYKNWLSEDFHEYLKATFLFHTPHYYGHSSLTTDALAKLPEDEKDYFYATHLNLTDSINQFLISKLKKSFNKKIKVNAMYINIQHPGMNGKYHTDNCDLTAVYMICGSGNLQILKEESSFEENKLVIFKSDKLHRGLAPNKGARISLAFKLNE